MILNTILLILFGSACYALGRHDQSKLNAILLQSSEDAINRATEIIAQLEAEAYHRAEASVRKESLRRQESRDLADERRDAS